LAERPEAIRGEVVASRLADIGPCRRRAGEFVERVGSAAERDEGAVVLPRRVGAPYGITNCQRCRRQPRPWAIRARLGQDTQRLPGELGVVEKPVGSPHAVTKHGAPSAALFARAW